MTQDEKILSKFIQRVSSRLKADQKAKGMKASGRSADSLKGNTEVKGDTTRGTLTGSSYWQQQEEGRGPSKKKGNGTPLWKEILENWIPYRSKFSGLDKKEKVSAASAIAFVIHRDGWDKDGARVETTKIIREERKILITEARGSNVQQFRSQIVKAFK